MGEEGEGIGLPSSLSVPAIYVNFWGLPGLSNPDFTTPDMKRVPVAVTTLSAKQTLTKTDTDQIHPFTHHPPSCALPIW
jgi:hypothetical protein